MGIVKFQVSVSLDGYLAGPDQRPEHPLGIGGEELHDWMTELEVWRRLQGMEGGVVNVSTPIVEEAGTNYGAVVMGRNMFGGGPGPWRDEPRWDGWWGEDPPYHTPVFVVTHHARAPQQMQGGTTFNFVTDGVEAALEQAREAAGDRDVTIGGGANVIQQCLAGGHVDEFQLHVAPILLGAGERLLEHVPGLAVEQLGAMEAPGVTHLSYRVRR